MIFTSKNNLDLIRLFAALQVALVHTAKHLEYDSQWIDWLNLFPGVPVFFFVSGMLIYGSYEKSLGDPQPMKNFYVKRFLRLYPALWVCVAFSILLLLISGYLTSETIFSYDFSVWILTSSTVFQFYNPEFLRGFGVGVINGSLWTVAVEIQFYILMPLLYVFLRQKSILVIFAILFLCVLNLVNTYFNVNESILGKLFDVSFLPWVYMFILGSLTYKYKNYFSLLANVPVVVLFVFYILIWFVSSNLGLAWGNGINVAGFLVLSALVTKLAFTKIHIADKLLKRHDISYGVYIFHMPIVNFILESRGTGFESWVLAIIATILVALFSWFLVERPSLKLKRRQLRTI